MNGSQSFDQFCLRGKIRVLRAQSTSPTLPWTARHTYTGVLHYVQHIRIAAAHQVRTADYFSFSRFPGACPGDNTQETRAPRA